MKQENISFSQKLFAKAQQSIPGGVNSPVRAFKSVGGTPLFMQKAKGAYMYDVDNNQYIDYINSWGPMILGHGHEEVVQAVQEKITHAISFGTPTEIEIALAEIVKEMAPNIDLVRLVNSGTEACMSAVRLARGYTGRNKFIKFEGCYHGHADPFLVKAGSGLATLNIQDTPGVPVVTFNDTVLAPFNNLDRVTEIMQEKGDEIAAIILEPVAGNMGCIIPEQGFLDGLRSLCTRYKSVLIFDEVMTGFRLAPGGAQERLKVDADLVTYGKVIGGGMPIGAFAGRKEIMEHIAPIGNVYQAGTLSGNPVSVTAGYTTLSILNNTPSIYTGIERKTAQLKTALETTFAKKGMPVCINQIGSMLSVHFTEEQVKDFETASACDIELFSKYFHHMLANGIYLPPSAYETWFISNTISAEDIEKTISVTEKF